MNKIPELLWLLPSGRKHAGAGVYRVCMERETGVEMLRNGKKTFEGPVKVS